MKKQDKIKQLTWKYFLQQKSKEIIMGAIILITPYFLGLGVDRFLPTFLDRADTFYEFYARGLLSVIVIFVLAFFFYFSFELIISWIESNWRKAEARTRGKE